MHWHRSSCLQVRSELISLYTADCIRRLIVEAVIPAVTQWVQSLRAKKRAAEEKHADRDKPQSLSVVAENLRKSEYEVRPSPP